MFLELSVVLIGVSSAADEKDQIIGGYYWIAPVPTSAPLHPILDREYILYGGGGAYGDGSAPTPAPGTSHPTHPHVYAPDGQTNYWAPEQPTSGQEWLQAAKEASCLQTLQDDAMWEYVQCSGRYLRGTSKSEAELLAAKIAIRQPYARGLSKSMANSRSYLAVPTRMTRSAAESHCAQFGGHLPSIHSSQENDLVSEMCKSMFMFSRMPLSEMVPEMYSEARESGKLFYSELCWMGLKRSNDTNSWDDGSAYDYSRLAMSATSKLDMFR